MRDWSEIPLDVLKEIAGRIDYCEDFQSFGKVCNWWRRAMKMSRCKTSWQKVPWLMLTEPVEQLLNLYSGNIRPLGAAAGDLSIQKRRYFSSCGWLISVTQIGLKVSLINPITGQTLQAPRLPNHLVCKLDGFWEEDMYLTYFKKFALSETPSNSSSDYTLAVALPVHSTVAFWRSADDDWTLIDHDNETPPNRSRRCYIDIIFREGEFYGLTEEGMIVAFGRGNRGPTPRVIVDLDWYFTVIPGAAYLVDSGGKLLLLRRDPCLGDLDSENHSYYTMDFNIWEVDVEAGRIKDFDEFCLGNRALFLGYNSSFSMDVSDVGFFKPNCIYYTDDLIQCYLYSAESKAGGSDMGVYDLIKNKKIEDFYNNPSCFSQVTPPLWIESPCQCDSYRYLKEDA